MNNMKFGFGAVSAAVLALSCGGENIVQLAGSGGGDVTCGPGTTLVGNVCIADGGDGGAEAGGSGGGDNTDTTPPVTTLTPTGTQCATGSNTATLSVNEASFIYYTLDGTEPTTASAIAQNQVILELADDASLEVKFFAVDLAGNQEAVQTETVSVDGAAPAAVTELAAVLNGTDAELTWSNPGSDFDEVVVFSTDGGLLDEPPELCGTEYTVGQTEGNATVEYVGTDQALTLPVGFGSKSYIVYAIDDVGNFSKPASRSVMRFAAPGDQTAVIEVADPLGTPAATVTTQPAVSSLAVSASVDGSNVTVVVDATNDDTGITMLAPKLEFSSVNDGSAVAGDVDGTLANSNPFWRVKSQMGIDAGATESFTIRIDGVTGAQDPLVINVGLLYSPVIVWGHRAREGAGLVEAMDSATGDSLGVFGSCGKNRCGTFGAVISPDNRRLYMGSRNNSVVKAFSLATGQLINSGSIVSDDVEKGSGSEKDNVDPTTVPVLAGDFARNRLLAGLSYRCRNSTRKHGGGVELVSLDPVTLQPMERVSVQAWGTGTLATAVALSPDGSVIGVATGDWSQETGASSGAHFFDANTLALMGSVNLTNEAPGIGEVRRMVFTSNATAAVASRRNGRLYEIDLAANFALSELTHDGPTGNNDAKVGSLTIGPAGALWATFHQQGGFVHFPSAAPGGTFYDVTGDVDSIAFSPDGSTAFASRARGDGNNGVQGSQIFLFDPTTLNPANPGSLTFTTVESIRGHKGHYAAMSPF